MSYKTILLVLSDADAAGSVLEAAVTISRNNNAHLIGLHAETLEMSMVYAPMQVPDVQSSIMLQDYAKERAEKSKAAFEARLSREDLPYEWRPMAVLGSFASKGILSLARTVDLIICAQSGDIASGGGRADVEELLFSSGRPVLFIPANGSVPARPALVTIAWNGSVEASRAVFSAMPLLLKAQAVDILIAHSGSDVPLAKSFDGADLAASLSRHGIKVSTTTVPTASEAVDVTLVAEINRKSPDLVVMGAYTHSRLREFVFGGVTSRMLTSMAIPTLMSH